MTGTDSADREESPAIDPDSVARSAALHLPKRRQRHRQPNWRWIASAFAVLFLVAIGVFLLLPKVVEQQRNENGSATEPGEAPVAAQSPPKTPAQPRVNQTASASFFKQRAEKALAEVLRQQSELDDHGVESWGGDEYQNALKKAAEGDEHLAKRAYQPALLGYESALSSMKALASSIPERLAQALKEGAEALAQGDSSRARQSFQLALAIDAENKEAKLGLARAETLDKLLAIIDTGEQYEQQNELDASKSAFQQAVKLDSNSEQAHQALERVNGRITARNYQRALDRGFASLANDQYKKARQAFTEAEAITAGTAEVKDGMAQAMEGIRLNKITDHRANAMDLEKQERWHEASEQYAAALSVDPDIQFARDGRSRSQKWAHLHDQFDHFLKQPSRLASDEPMKHAAGLIAHASALESKGPALVEKITRLQELIEQAKTPVKVLLESDNKTEVVVYKVGRFGKFTTRELMLRPGDYTIVGRRDGFRDVRQQVAVVAGRNVPPVVVRCEEPI